MIRAGKRVFPHITQMQKLHNGEIWVVTTGQGIFRLDEEKQQAESIDAIMRQVNYNFQSNLYEDSDYNIWIGTEGQAKIRKTFGMDREAIAYMRFISSALYLKERNIKPFYQ